MVPFGSTRQEDKLRKDLARAEASRDPAVWRELEDKYGPDFPAQVLYLLTRKHFDPASARHHWRHILEHNRYLEETLGRPVGVRIALADYFLNIRPALHDPLLVEGEIFRQRERSALHDELTGLYNRRFFRSALARMVAEARRYHQPFSLLMVDVDHFKHYNDLNGHPAGDRCLARVAHLLRDTAREVDQVVRYGGEEFALLLPRCPKHEAAQVAERHRRAIETHPFPGQDTQPGGNLTISLGVATFPNDAQSARDLIHRADSALYAAKQAGRNCVVSSSPERRRYPRIHYQVPVDFRWGASDFRRGLTLDISLGGVRLQAREPVDTGQPLELIIRAPGKDLNLKVQGRSVHVERDPVEEMPYRMGVRLERAFQREAFQELLADRSSLH